MFDFKKKPVRAGCYEPALKKVILLLDETLNETHCYLSVLILTALFPCFTKFSEKRWAGEQDIVKQLQFAVEIFGGWLYPYTFPIRDPYANTSSPNYVFDAFLCYGEFYPSYFHGFHINLLLSENEAGERSG